MKNNIIGRYHYIRFSFAFPRRTEPIETTHSYVPSVTNTMNHHLPRILASLLLCLVAASSSSETLTTIACNSLCENDGSLLQTPDLVIEYNWNPRVPTCSGLGCETAACSSMELKLPSFGDSSDCSIHRKGLQDAGCKCSSASKSGPKLGVYTVASVMVIATLLHVTTFS